MNRWLCGVPDRSCLGTKTQVNSFLANDGQAHKTHASPEEAFKCMVKHLLVQGYKQVGSREFLRGDEPVLILNKKSHFGSRLRTGKAGRTQPRRGSGVIVG